MSHRNAVLTPVGRLRLAPCVVDDGWPLRRAAERFQVSVPTASGWARRSRERDLAWPAIEAMTGRSSRPRRNLAQTRRPVVRRILHLRRTCGWALPVSAINSVYAPPRSTGFSAGKECPGCMRST